MPILNSFSIKYRFIWVILALLPLFVMGQDETFDQRWEELNEGIQYKPSKRPKGPEKDYISPQQFNESKALQNKVNKSATDDEIITSREKRFANGRSEERRVGK